MGQRGPAHSNTNGRDKDLPGPAPRGFEYPAKYGQRSSPSLGENRLPEGGKRCPMWTTEVVAFAPLRDGSDKHGLMRPKIVPGIRLRELSTEIPANRHHVEHRRREATDLCYVSCHRQRFQKDLGRHDCRPEAQDHTIAEPL